MNKKLISRKDFSYSNGVEEIANYWSDLLLKYHKRKNYGILNKEHSDEAAIMALREIYDDGTRWPDFEIDLDNPVRFFINNTSLVIDRTLMDNKK